jgi:ribosomal protein L7/L12
MDTQTLLIIGAVVVVGMLVVVWQQRQGVVKRPNPTNSAADVHSQMVDWLAEKDEVPLTADWGEGAGLSQEQAAQINAEMIAGRKINAIKLYREFTGEGLKEAKEAVEAIERGQRPTRSSYHGMATNQPVGDVLTQIEQELREGRKINAVKLYRETYGVGLKEAKDAVDEMQRNLGKR